MAGDYSDRNVRNRDFARESLLGADFSGSDVRGADFSDADLRGAKFVRSRGGVPPLWAALVVGVSLVLASIIGSLAAIATDAMARRLGSGEAVDKLAVVVVAAIGIAMILIALFANLERAIRIGAATAVAVLAVVVPLLVIRDDFLPQATAIAIVWVVAIFGTFAIGAAARATADIISPLAFLIVSAVGALTAKTAGGAILAVLIAIAAVILARRALADPDEAGWLFRRSAGLVLRRATSYRGADLTGADFTDAITGPSDYTDALVTGARFTGASVTGRGSVTPDRLLQVARKDL